MKTLTGCWASFLAMCGVHHVRQSNILIILSRVHSTQLWLPRHNGRVQLGTYTVWILTLSIAEFETGTTWGSSVEFDLYRCLKPYLEITFSLMKVLENGEKTFHGWNHTVVCEESVKRGHKHQEAAMQLSLNLWNTWGMWKKTNFKEGISGV